MHFILILKLGDHEGLALFVHGQLLKRTLLVVLPVILIQIPIRASQYQFCIFHIISLHIISIISVTSKTFLHSICKSLSLFLLFPSSTGRVGVNR